MKWASATIRASLFCELEKARDTTLNAIMRIDFLTSWLVVLAFLSVQSFLPGCTSVTTQPEVLTPEKESRTLSREPVDLSGIWEYQDKDAAYPLTLDEEGNGRYNWQGGHFVTISIVDDRWQGKWRQTANDREGGFALRLSSDGNYAEGRWWYTRIEDNDSPTEPGGSFTLLRNPSSSQIDTGSCADPFGELEEVFSSREC